MQENPAHDAGFSLDTLGDPNLNLHLPLSYWGRGNTPMDTKQLIFLKKRWRTEVGSDTYPWN